MLCVLLDASLRASLSWRNEGRSVVCVLSWCGLWAVGRIFSPLVNCFLEGLARAIEIWDEGAIPTGLILTACLTTIIFDMGSGRRRTRKRWRLSNYHTKRQSDTFGDCSLSPADSVSRRKTCEAASVHRAAREPPGELASSGPNSALSVNVVAVFADVGARFRCPTVFSPAIVCPFHDVVALQFGVAGLDIGMRVVTFWEDATHRFRIQQSGLRC